MAEVDPEPTAFGAGQRLGAPETLGISTLDPAHRPPAMPPGRHVTVRVRMLDDTEELFDVSVSVGKLPASDWGSLHYCGQLRRISQFCHSSTGGRLVTGWHGNCVSLSC